MTSLAKRKQAKRKQAQRKQAKSVSLRWVKPALAASSVLFSVIGLMVLSTWLNDPQAWPLRDVAVEGEFRQLQQADIEEIVSPLLDDGFFGLDVASLQAGLQLLPWVERVSVRRAWPDQIRIHVVEQRAVAHWGANGFLNTDAVVFKPERASELVDLPKLSGPDGSELRVLAMHKQLTPLLYTALQLNIRTLTLDARRAWRLELSNNLVLEVGRGEPLARVARFISVYPSILAAGDGPLSLVDLRYSNGFAIRRQSAQKNSKEFG